MLHPLPEQMPRCLGHKAGTPDEWCEHINECQHHKTMHLIDEPWHTVKTYYTLCANGQRGELAP